MRRVVSGCPLRRGTDHNSIMAPSRVTAPVAASMVPDKSVVAAARTVGVPMAASAGTIGTGIEANARSWLRIVNFPWGLTVTSAGNGVTRVAIVVLGVRIATLRDTRARSVRTADAPTSGENDIGNTTVSTKA